MASVSATSTQPHEAQAALSVSGDHAGSIRSKSHVVNVTPKYEPSASALAKAKSLDAAFPDSRQETGPEFLEAMKARQAMLERQDSKGNFKHEDTLPQQLLSSSSQCSEFFRAPAVRLLDDLRAKYDPTGEGAKLHPQLHSDQALLQRESLKFDPLIIKTLDDLWKIIDTNKNGVLEKEEYHEFHSKLALVLVPTASIRQSQIFYEQDWERDTKKGKRKVTKSVFGDSMFELADRWTDSISASAYIRFLQGTFQALSELDPSGHRVYRSDASIRANMAKLKPFSSLHEKTLSLARAKAAAYERARARARREGRDLTWEEFEILYDTNKDQFAEPTDKDAPVGARLYANRALQRTSTGLAHDQIRRALEEAAQGLRPHSHHGLAKKKRAKAAAAAAAKAVRSEQHRKSLETLQSRRFYPPPASWWARHSRRKFADERARMNALTGSTNLAFCPEGQDLVGVLLFDARDPRRLFHLIVSTQKLSVEDNAVIELRHALRREILDGEDRLLVTSPCEERLPLAKRQEFTHAVGEADWVGFCTRVDELATGSNKLWVERFEFTGFVSAYNTQAGGICCNFLFDSAEMSSKFNHISARPQLGLGCPYLQAQVARFISHKLRVEFGNGAPSTVLSGTGYPSMLRSTSSKILLETLDKGRPDPVPASQTELKEPERLHEVLKAPAPRLHRTQSSLDKAGDDAEVRNIASRFGLEKRHTLGALDDKERRVKDEVLSQRQLRRVALLEKKYRQGTQVPTLASFLESQYGKNMMSSLPKNYVAAQTRAQVSALTSQPNRKSLPALPGSKRSLYRP